MSQDIYKEDYLNYLVNVKGYSEEDANKIFIFYGVECVKREDLLEFYQFIS